MRRTLITLLALLLLAVPARAQSPKPEDDTWFVVSMQGQRCGHMHAWTVRTPERLTNASELKLEIKRGQLNMTVSIASEFVETPEHKPVSMKSEMKLGALPQIDEYAFQAEGIQATHTIGDSKRSETLPAPTVEWMTPGAMEQHIASRIAAGDKEISVRSMEPSSGLTLATTTMKLLEKTALDVVGKTVPAIKWSVRNSAMPSAESTEYTDDRGQPLRSETSIGGIKLILTRADKALALSKHGAPELLESTFIVPDKQIAGARSSAVGEFVLKCPDCPIGEWPAAGAQTVTKIDEHTVKVRIESARASDAAKDDADNPRYLKPSSLVTSDDAEVVKLKERALSALDRADRRAQAEALRKFTYEFITKKSFDVGFASAAETARTHCGDCTEHAVLLAALLRADGIPSRCVSGIVYADGIGRNGNGAMGYHMWTQALIDGKWRDLDAALSDSIPMDATHIAIQTLSLADGETVNALMDILPTLGKLTVHVDHVDQPAKR